MDGDYNGVMEFGKDSRNRRWWSLFYLATAAAMMTWGQMLFETYIKSRGVVYLFFWGCALVMALASLRLAAVEVFSVLKHYMMQKRRLKKQRAALDQELDQLIASSLPIPHNKSQSEIPGIHPEN